MWGLAVSPAAVEQTAQLLAPPAVPAQAMPPASQAASCVQLPCREASAGEGRTGQQQPQSPPAALRGDGDVSRRAGAAADATGAASSAQQQPGTAPCTPEALCEAAGEQRPRTAGQTGQAPAISTAEDAAAPFVAASGPCGAEASHHTLHRLQSFVHCVAGSPIVQSALLYLEQQGEHPTVLPASRAAAGPAGRAAAAGLEWTMAQLLSLWLRAGYTHARESALLSALWVLESAHSAWRSPSSLCLSTYTKYVGAFSQQVVRRLTDDWPASFNNLKRSLVEAQMELLQRTSWRVRLDLAADVLPCYAMLFCPTLLGEPKLWLGQQAAPALPPEPTVGAEHREWAAAMRFLCAIIREKSRQLKAHQQACTSIRLPTPECEDEDERPAKRQRASSLT